MGILSKSRFPLMDRTIVSWEYRVPLSYNSITWSGLKMCIRVEKAITNVPAQIHSGFCLQSGRTFVHKVGMSKQGFSPNDTVYGMYIIVFIYTMPWTFYRNRFIDIESKNLV